MAKEDEEKTAFYTDRETLWLPKKPFGSKERRPPYQRLAKSAKGAPSLTSTQLKNITKENKHEYRWTAKAEEAFQQMKGLIMSLPSLTPPYPEETLYAYLAVSGGSLPHTRSRDRKGRQCPLQNVTEHETRQKGITPHWEKNLALHGNMTRRAKKRKDILKLIIKGPSPDQPSQKYTHRDMKFREASKICCKRYDIQESPHNPRNAIKGQVLARFPSDPQMERGKMKVFQSPEVPPEIDDTEAWTLYTDGAASSKGSGAGLVLTGPSGVEYAYYASGLTFATQITKQKMRPLLSGLRMTRMKNVRWIDTKRSNQKADYLSKLATVQFHNLPRKIWVAVLNERSTEVQEVQTIVEEEGDNWMTPIIKYLEEGIVPSDKNEARALRAKIGQYTMESGVLFKKGYLIPMLRCVGPLQANYVIREIHMGSCESAHTTHRTSIKQSNGETPFSLTYGSEAVILAEIGMPSYRTLMIREEFNEEEQRLNLDLLQERREAAAIREARYKSKMEQYYNKKVRPAGFRPGEFVYRRNEASRVEDQGKLGPKWEGPYRVTEAFENGSYKLQTMEDKIVPRTWHAINLRKCYL
ncbi:hypothetical protein Tco_0218447 [Tanacetum coccineum]